MKQEFMYKSFFHLAYNSGNDNLTEALDMDSNDLYNKIIVEWANEFDYMHQHTKWDKPENDFLKAINDFYISKRKALIIEVINSKLPKLNLPKFFGLDFV